MPDGVPFGSKSGWVGGIRHDVAFVGEPGPGALVVAVCTRGYEAPDAEEALRTIGSLAVSLANRGEAVGSGSSRVAVHATGRER